MEQFVFRIYCETESAYITTDWATEAPSACPNNAEHTVNLESLSVEDTIESSGEKDIPIVIGGLETPYYECQTGEWESIRQFIFNGTNVLGTPKEIKIIASVMDSIYPGECRVIDTLNGDVIISWSQIDSTVPKVFSDNTLENLPETESIFEIQGKSYSAHPSRRIVISTMLMTF